MPLCSDCRSEAEFTTTGESETCSRCGEPCDNCGGFTATNTAAPTAGIPSLDTRITTGEALADPWLAYILGMATMGLICAAVLLL